MFVRVFICLISLVLISYSMLYKGWELILWLHPNPDSERGHRNTYFGLIFYSVGASGDQAAIFV